jgi:hypothetical protein
VCPNKNDLTPSGASCNGQQRAVGPDPTYSTTKPDYVHHAVYCDIKEAIKDTKGTKVDFLKRRVTFEITWTGIKTDSSPGVSGGGTIPVFLGSSVSPSLAASRVTNVTQVGTESISIDDPTKIFDDPALAHECDDHTPNKWLINGISLHTANRWKTVGAINEAVQFVVTRKENVGLNFNIIPVWMDDGY